MLHKIDLGALAANKVGLNSARGELIALYATLLRDIDEAKLAILAYRVQIRN
jgi:hypothetical protein